MKETTPWMLLAEVAEGFIGQRESSRNRSPFIEKVWLESGIGKWGYEDCMPWCAAFVSFCMMRASKCDLKLELPFKLTPSVAQFIERANDAKVQRLRWQDARRGDIVTFLPHFSHIGIVAERVASGLITIEGNTNSGGGREGDGVYRKERAGEICGALWALPVGLGVAK